MKTSPRTRLGFTLIELLVVIAIIAILVLERISEDEYVVSGALPAHDLEELVRVPLQSESATTSGFVTARLGGFPKVGDIVVLGAFELRVEQIAEHRVERVRLVRRALPPGPVGTSV